MLVVLNDGVCWWSDESAWTAAAASTWRDRDMCVACHGGKDVRWCGSQVS